MVYSYSLVKIAKVDTNVSTTDKNANPAVSAYITLKNDNGSIVYKDTAISGYDASTYVKDAYVAAVISEAAATTAIGRCGCRRSSRWQRRMPRPWSPCSRRQPRRYATFAPRAWSWRSGAYPPL